MARTIVKFDFDNIESSYSKVNARLDSLLDKINTFAKTAKFSSSDWNGIAADSYNNSIDNIVAYMKKFHKGASACNEKLKQHITNYGYIDRL